MIEPNETASPTQTIVPRAPTTRTRTRWPFSSAGLISPETVGERFWGLARSGPGCWEWTGSRFTAGYGQFTLRRQDVGNGPRGQVLAHRMAYYLTHGPFEGDILHSCDNPPCVRPDHLHLGTPRMNSREVVERGRHHSQRKDHCPKGHPYDQANTAWIKNRKRQFRRCKTCNREWSMLSRRQHGQAPRADYLAAVRAR